MLSVLKVFKNILVILVLVVVIVLLVRNSDAIKNQALSILHLSPKQVAGLQTKRGEQITNQLQSDVQNQMDTVKKQALNVKVGDVIELLGRAQKIIHDAQTFEEYIKEQIDNLGKKK